MKSNEQKANVDMTDLDPDPVCHVIMLRPAGRHHDRDCAAGFGFVFCLRSEMGRKDLDGSSHRTHKNRDSGTVSQSEERDHD